MNYFGLGFVFVMLALVAFGVWLDHYVEPPPPRERLRRVIEYNVNRLQKVPR